MDLISDRSAVESDKERENPRNFDVPSEFRDVPHPGFVHKGVHTETAKTGLEIFGMGIVRLQRLKYICHVNLPFLVNTRT